MKCRYFLYIAELTILDCSATGCNGVRWNLTQSWGRKSHIHWHTCQLTEIDRSVTVCLTVTLYFSQTVCLCFCWLKKRVQVLAPAQTKNEKQQSSNQNKVFLGNVMWMPIGFEWPIMKRWTFWLFWPKCIICWIGNCLTLVESCNSGSNAV